MTGVELILLILAVLGLLSGSYFAAWWYCNGVKLEKTNHLILEEDLNGNATMRKESKLYTGLDTVDEARILKLSPLQQQQQQIQLQQESEMPLPPPTAPGDVNLEQQHYFTTYSVTTESASSSHQQTVTSLSEPRVLPN